jgi:hypothetical protein
MSTHDLVIIGFGTTAAGGRLAMFAYPTGASDIGYML